MYVEGENTLRTMQAPRGCSFGATLARARGEGGGERGAYGERVLRVFLVSILPVNIFDRCFFAV